MLSKEETSRRLEGFLGWLNQELKFPLPLQMAANQFLPLVPSLLQDREQEEKLKTVLNSIAWVMGYGLKWQEEEDTAE